MDARNGHAHSGTYQNRLSPAHRDELRQAHEKEKFPFGMDPSHPEAVPPLPRRK